MDLPIEVGPLVVELQDLRVLYQERETSTHQFRILADELVEDFAMLGCEVEKQSLQTVRRLQGWRCHGLLSNVSGDRYVFQRSVFADQH